MTRKKKSMLAALKRKQDVWDRYNEAVWDYNSRARAYLESEGWIRESRYDGSMRWEHVYRRPTGSTWHTPRGALERQSRREAAAKRKGK